MCGVSLFCSVSFSITFQISRAILSDRLGENVTRLLWRPVNGRGEHSRVLSLAA